MTERMRASPNSELDRKLDAARCLTVSLHQSLEHQDFSLHPNQHVYSNRELSKSPCAL